jgi:hypothetical protein
MTGTIAVGVFAATFFAEATVDTVSTLPFSASVEVFAAS